MSGTPGTKILNRLLDRLQRLSNGFSVKLEFPTSGTEKLRVFTRENHGEPDRRRLRRNSRPRTMACHSEAAVPPGDENLTEKNAERCRCLLRDRAAIEATGNHTFVHSMMTCNDPLRFQLGITVTRIDADQFLAQQDCDRFSEKKKKERRT